MVRTKQVLPSYLQRGDHIITPDGKVNVVRSKEFDSALIGVVIELENGDHVYYSSNHMVEVVIEGKK